jgi:hypothetical protein
MKYWLIVLLTSCSSHFPPIRGEYVLTDTGSFVVSNMYVNPANLDSNEKSIFIRYDIVVKNVSQTPQKIELEKASIKINEQDFPIVCSNFQSKSSAFSIATGEQARIACLATIDKKMGLAKSDYRSIIEIPLASDKARFAYLIRAEDFK